MFNLFRWSCDFPYTEINETHDEITRMENTSSHLSEQANLFEVAYTDFKIVQCLRKDLGSAKVFLLYY